MFGSLFWCFFTIPVVFYVFFVPPRCCWTCGCCTICRICDLICCLPGLLPCVMLLRGECTNLGVSRWGWSKTLPLPSWSQCVYVEGKAARCNLETKTWHTKWSTHSSTGINILESASAQFINWRATKKTLYILPISCVSGLLVRVDS